MISNVLGLVLVILAIVVSCWLLLGKEWTPEERKRALREDASSRTLWAHLIESRDGRLLFENFLGLALEHVGG